MLHQQYAAYLSLGFVWACRCVCFSIGTLFSHRFISSLCHRTFFMQSESRKGKERERVLVKNAWNTFDGPVCIGCDGFYGYAAEKESKYYNSLHISWHWLNWFPCVRVCFLFYRYVGIILLLLSSPSLEWAHVCLVQLVSLPKWIQIVLSTQICLQVT